MINTDGSASDSHILSTTDVLVLKMNYKNILKSLVNKSLPTLIEKEICEDIYQSSISYSIYTKA